MPLGSQKERRENMGLKFGGGSLKIEEIDLRKSQTTEVTSSTNLNQNLYTHTPQASHRQTAEDQIGQKILKEDRGNIHNNK